MVNDKLILAWLEELNSKKKVRDDWYKQAKSDKDAAIQATFSEEEIATGKNKDPEAIKEAAEAVDAVVQLIENEQDLVSKEIRLLEEKIVARVEQLTKENLDKVRDFEDLTPNEPEALVIESNGLKLPIELDYTLQPGEIKVERYIAETKKLLEEVEKENLHVIQIPIKMVPKFAFIESNPEFTSTYEMEKRVWDTLPPKVYEYGICHNMKNDHETNIIVNWYLPEDLIIVSDDRDGQFCRREVSVKL